MVIGRHEDGARESAASTIGPTDRVVTGLEASIVTHDIHVSQPKPGTESVPRLWAMGKDSQVCEGHPNPIREPGRW